MSDEKRKVRSFRTAKQGQFTGVWCPTCRSHIVVHVTFSQARYRAKKHTFETGHQTYWDEVIRQQKGYEVKQ